MTSTNLFFTTAIRDSAERELSAFLGAVGEFVGEDALVKASEIWIEIMEDHEWTNHNFDQFFRNVTIRAAAQLRENPEGGTTRGETSCSSSATQDCIGSIGNA